MGWPTFMDLPWPMGWPSFVSWPMFINFPGSRMWPMSEVAYVYGFVSAHGVSYVCGLRTCLGPWSGLRLWVVLCLRIEASAIF